MTTPDIAVTALPERPVGPFRVSAIGMGCMNLSHGYGAAPSEEESARLLNRALDLGVTFLDTAALYGGGNNERLVGKAVIHRRAEFTLASKCVLDLVDGERILDGRPAAILATLDRALARLDKTVPVEESVGALARAKEAGKIGAIGLSEMSAGTLRRAQAVHPIAAMQSEYSPISRNVEIGMLDACRELGTAFVAFSPTGRGLLARAIRSDDYRPGDLRRQLPRYTQPRLGRNMALVDRFEALAADAGLTPAQLAIGWGLARAPHIVSIPGTTSIAHLEENVAARPITDDLVAAVDALFPPNTLAGARYGAAMQAQIDTELFPDEELAEA